MQITSLGSSEKQHLKKVYYTGTDTMKGGYLLCYDRDRGTAASVVMARATYVEKPAAGNRNNFAGAVSSKSDGKTGPCEIEIIEPTGALAKIFANESCTLGTTFLTLQAGSYYAGGIGEGPIIAKAYQTLDRSSTAGGVQCHLFGSGVDFEKLAISGTAALKGPSPLIWDDCPWVEIGNDPTIGFRHFDDYLGTIDVTTADGYVVTTVNSGNIEAVVDEQGGVLQVSSGGNNATDDGANVQLQNCMFKSAAGVRIFFEARCKMTDTGDDQYYIGLAGVDTTLIAAGIMDDAVDKCGFYRIAATTADKICTITARTSADDATADVATIADATYVKLGFVINGLTSVKFYVNGTLVETGTTVANIANAVMCLSYAAQVEQTSSDADLEIDWVRIAQVGGRI